MGIIKETSEELKAHKVEELKKLLDRFAGMAMQSLMQHWLVLDENGNDRASVNNSIDFDSLASCTILLGWGESYPDKGVDHSFADELASTAYFIAEAMIKRRKHTLENLSGCFEISEFIEN